MTTFIYALKDPETGKIRYIGKAKDCKARLRGHLSDSRKHGHKNNWVKGLLSRGKKPELEILDEVVLCEWKFWEREWISWARIMGFDLLNMTEGGEGFSEGATNAGNIAAANYRRGRPLSQEHRDRIGVANLGKKLSPEHIEKIRLQKVGTRQTEKQKEAARRANSHPKSLETKARMLVAQNNPEHRQKQSERMKQIWSARKGNFGESKRI